MEKSKMRENLKKRYKLENGQRIMLDALIKMSEVENIELNSIFNKDILAKDIEQILTHLVDNKDFNEKNKVIVDEIMDKLFDNEFKLLSEEFKSYIAESTINAGLDTLEKNIIPILKSLDLQSITLDEVDRMHPSEIHELIKSFAGDFFVKLYIYGGFGLIFGVNVYLSILLFIIEAKTSGITVAKTVTKKAYTIVFFNTM